MRSKIYLLIGVVVLAALSGCQKKNQNIMEDHEYTNHLIHENSPYLLQHAHNPVDWYPWGPEALEKAKNEDKLILISIGYAACHWCHVMEKESFEDSTVAAIMNEHFVNIKVDREERPDVDDVYMTACQLASNRGCGWPLNAFALPDGRPFWAGTYFPKNDWMRLLEQFIQFKNDQPDQLAQFADQIAQGFEVMDKITPVAGDLSVSEEELHMLSEAFLSKLDFKEGGRKGAPKFPMPNNYEFLLKYGQLFDNAEAMEIVNTTLFKMAEGGIYDHAGGGFSRYSVDALWRVPHFEKMLYDNGQLLDLYAQAYAATKNPYYEKVIRRSIEWMTTDLLDKTGGFYSSYDADSEGEEGKFYVWSKDEIYELITDPQDIEIVEKRYDIRDNTNWNEHDNILFAARPIEAVANMLDLEVSEVQDRLDVILQTLYEARKARVMPGLDDKILTSWNGLAVQGLLRSYTALGDESYKEAALKTLDFMSREMKADDNRLNRNFKDGKSKINGFLDDYATFISALIDAYQVTFDEKYLFEAKDLLDYVLVHFEDSENMMLFYTSDMDPPLVTRKKVVSDNVISASNSIMARNIYYLGLYFYNMEWIERAGNMMKTIKVEILKNRQPNYYSNWCQLYIDLLKPPYEVAIVGPDWESKLQEMQSHYLPNVLFLGGSDEGSLELLQDKLQGDDTYIYVCQNKVCKLPVKEVSEALKLID